MYEELVRPRVLAAVEDLAAREASGVFEVTGNPSGAIYLDGGRIAFARASWVPGLAARLGALYPALAVPAGQDADDIAVASLAVQHGYLMTAALEEIFRSIVVDAFLVLTVPLAADSPVAAFSFTSTRTYWTGMFPRLGLDSVRGEAVKRAKRIAACGLSPTAGVALRDLAGPVAVLTREQWAVACQIGDQASARDLAMRFGGSLSATVECLGTLIRAGVCAPARTDPVHTAPAASPTGPTAETTAETTAEPAPIERLPPRRRAQYLPARIVGASQPPAMDILHQVLSGLRKLS